MRHSFRSGIAPNFSATRTETNGSAMEVKKMVGAMKAVAFVHSDHPPEMKWGHPHLLCAH